MELIYSSGLRLAELVSLDIDTIDFRDGEMVVIGKGSKSRTGRTYSLAAHGLPSARGHGEPLSALLAQLPERYTFSERLQDYPTTQSQALIAHLEEGSEADILARLTAMFGGIAGKADGIDRTDGLRIHFAGGDIVHLRPSGNAPELRCYTESGTAELAEKLNGEALEIVQQQGGSAQIA